MFDALYIGATGMQAQQLHVDTIANNLANVNTPGFKKARVSFTDLMMSEASRQTSAPADQARGNLLAPLGSTGVGVGVNALGKLFEPGAMNPTGSSWDVAIEGDGFVEVQLPDGGTAYSRGGSTKVNNEGVLVSQSGHPFKPGITIPATATSVAIAPDGTVSVTTPQQPKPTPVGQLQMVRFANPMGLIAQGDNLYRSSDASGEPMAGQAGQEGIGSMRQGFLEASNVKMVDEMVSLMVAQRAYQASVKVVQASDELLGMVNNLRR